MALDGGLVIFKTRTLDALTPESFHSQCPSCGIGQRGASATMILGGRHTATMMFRFRLSSSISI